MDRMTENSTLDHADTRWPVIGINILGPDATTVVGLVQWMCCPRCGAMICPATEDGDFPQWHADWHRETEDHHDPMEFAHVVPPTSPEH